MIIPSCDPEVKFWANTQAGPGDPGPFVVGDEERDDYGRSGTPRDGLR